MNYTVYHHDFFYRDTALYDKQMRSVGAYYLNGAQRCDCNTVGSYSNVSCEIFTGQCSCKPGVTGRRCDTCMLEYFGLTSEGCKRELLVLQIPYTLDSVMNV